MNSLQGNLSSFVGGGSSGSASSGSSGAGQSNLWSPQGLAANNAAFGVGGSNPFANAAGYMQSGLWGGMGAANNYAAGLESQREGLMNQVLGQLSTGGIQSASARTNNAIMQNAGQSGQQAAMAMQGMGYGSGVSGGMMGAMLGQGQTQANAATQHFNDPMYQSSVLQQGLGAISQGMQNPLAQQAMGYEPIIMGQNQTNYNQRGQGLFGQIAPILGQVMGGPMGSSLFGGGGSGGGYGMGMPGAQSGYYGNPYAYGGQF